MSPGSAGEWGGACGSLCRIFAGKQEQDDLVDQGDAIDIAALFEAIQGRTCALRVLVGTEPIPHPVLPDRLFFERREG